MYGRRIGTGRRDSLAWRLMPLLALIGMMLSSLGGALAAGQQAPPPIEQEEQADQPAVETAAPAETQPANTGEATEPPGGQQVNQPPIGREPSESPFFLQVIKRVCPAKDGFIPESASYAELDDGCRLEVADPASFFFIVIDATGQEHVVNDIAAFFELPVGRTVAYEKHGGGYGDPTVWCSFGKGEPPQRMRVVDRGVALDSKPEMLVTCEFFNPELPNAPEASLTIHKRNCAEGYDLGSEKVDPIVDCKEPAIKVPFALADDDASTPDRQQATGEVIESGVVFEGLAGGHYTVTETPPEGVTGAVVWTCEIGERSIDGDEPPLSEGFTLDLEIPAGAELTCFWFNLRGEPGSGDDGSITVVKRLCPAGYEAKSEKADPLVDCTKPLDDVGFALMPADPDVDPQKGSTGEDGDGTLTFEGLPAGRYTVEENPPEGIAGGFVWACTEDPREQRGIDGPLAEGARLEVDLAAGQDLWCLWLNVAEKQPAEPTPGTTPTAEPTEPSEATGPLPTERSGTGMEGDLIVILVDSEGQPVGGACVALIGADGETVAESCDTVAWEQESLAGNGVTGFFAIPAGEYTVRLVSEPDGGTAEDTVVTVIVGASTQVMLTVGPPAEPDAPGEGNTVTVRTWQCPAGTGYGQDQAWYIENCAQPMDGIAFILIDGDGASTRVTAGGTVQWTEVVAGSVALREEIPEGYGDPVMYCTASFVDSISQNPLSDGIFGLGTGAYAQPFFIDCDWYNLPQTSGEPLPTESAFTIGPDATEIPMPPDATAIAVDSDGAATVATAAPGEPAEGQDVTGSITVMKVTCPDGATIDRSNPTRTCRKLTDGISFTVVAEDGESQRARTGEDGRGVVTFDALPAGSYEVIEAAQAGTEPMVWACAASLRDLAGADGPLAEGGSVTVALGAGEDLTCLWLNVPTVGESAAAIPTPVVAVPVEALPAVGEIRISAFACDPGFSRAAYYPVSLDDLHAGCTQPFIGNVFFLGGANAGASGVTDASGQITFANLAMGETYINQRPRSGYTHPIVDCSDAGGSLQQPTDGFFATVAITAESATKTCEWFVIPLTDDFHLNRIHVGAYRCEDFGPDETPAAGRCGWVEEPYTLTVSGDQGWEYSWTLEPGTYYVSSPPDQALTLLMEMPGEWDGMRASCRVVDWAIRSTVVQDLGWLEVSGEGTVSVPPIGTNNRLVCEWYSIVNAAGADAEAPEATSEDDQALAGSGRVRVSITQCPPGVPYDTVAQAAETSPVGAGGLCQPMIGEAIVLRHASASGTGTVDRGLSTGTNGGVFWDDGVPQGAWALIRAPWPGEEGNPLVMCRYVNPPQGVDDGWRISSDVPGGVYEDIFPEADMLAECHWYVIPTVDPGGANRVDLTVHACPAGTDIAAVADAWPAGGAGDCTPAEGVEVTLGYAGANGVGDIRRPLVTDADGVALWPDGVPTAPWWLSRDDGTGASLVACRYDAVPGAEPEWRVALVAEGGVFESSFAGVYDHPPEQQADLLDRCHWFMILAPGDPEPEATMPAPWTPTVEVATVVPTETAVATDATGSIAVVKVTCPAGFDVDTGDPARECTKRTDGISFTVVSGTGDMSQRGDTGEDGRGRVAFVELPAGSYEIVEAAQAGTAPVVWACAASLRDLTGTDGPLAEGGSVTVALGEGEDITCLWLNVPSDDVAAAGPDTASLRVTARWCGSAQPEPPSIDAYRASCPDRFDTAFSLVLQYPDGTVDTVPSARIDELGVIEYVDLAASEAQLMNYRLTGINQPVVFCRTGASWTSMDLLGGIASWFLRVPLEASAEVACEWYFSADPEQPGRLIAVSHFVCDAAVVAPSEETCTWNNDRFVHAVDREDVSGSPAILTRLILPFNIVTPGSAVPFVVIDHTFTPVARPPMAYCGPWDGTAASPETNPNHGWLDASGESGIAFAPMDAGESLRCDWFAFPAAGG